MSHAGHFQYKCTKCGKICGGCRCMEPGKETRPAVCEDCDPHMNPAPQAPAVPQGEVGQLDVGYFRRRLKSLAEIVDKVTPKELAEHLGRLMNMTGEGAGSAVASPEASPQMRAALADALEGLEDMIGYIDEYFRKKWDHQGYIDRAREALGASPRPATKEPEHPLKDFFSGESHACVTGWNLIGSKADCKSCNPGAEGKKEGGGAGESAEKAGEAATPGLREAADWLDQVSMTGQVANMSHPAAIAWARAGYPDLFAGFVCREVAKRLRALSEGEAGGAPQGLREAAGPLTLPFPGRAKWRVKIWLEGEVLRWDADNVGGSHVATVAELAMLQALGYRPIPFAENGALGEASEPVSPKGEPT